MYSVTAASLCVPSASATAPGITMCPEKDALVKCLVAVLGKGSSALLEVHRCAKWVRCCILASSLSICVCGVVTTRGKVLFFFRDSRWFRQARKPLPTACGGMAKSARCCPARPSRRFPKRMMEQWALHPQGTLLFLPRAPVLPTRLSARCFPSFWLDTASFRSCLCCHWDSLTRWRLALAQEAARVASSSSSHCSFEPRCAL